MITPGLLCVVKKGAVDISPVRWGMEVTALHRIDCVHWWAGVAIGPPDVIGPAWWCRDSDGKEGYMLEQSLEPKRPPREPTASWDDMPLWNPTRETVT